MNTPVQPILHISLTKLRELVPDSLRERSLFHEEKGERSEKLKLNRETLSGLEEPVLDVAQGGASLAVCGTTCNTRLTCSSNLC